MSDTTRRDFIKTGAGAVGAGLALPVLNRQAMGTTVVEMLRDDLVADGKILVVIELAGGNDPLNTIVPLQQYDTYASFRSRIAIQRDQVLPLYGSTTMGLSPNLSAIKPIADAGKLAVIQMCHYPNPNLSHDGSRTIYRLADTSNSATLRSGWIGRHSALFGNRNNSLDTVGIGGAAFEDGEREGLLDEVVGAFPHRGDGRLDRAVGGHEDDERLGIELADLREHVEAARAAYIVVDPTKRKPASSISASPAKNAAASFR